MTNSVSKTLIKLTQLDIDAIHAYEQAIKNIEDSEIRNALEKFRGDHQQHVTDLAAEIQRLGEEPPKSQDIKGFAIEGFTAIQSLIGTKGALKAMEGNEELTNKTYRDALQEDLPASLKTLIEKNYSDEQRHLAYIKEALTRF